ncbi:MAG: hypothetical protein Q9172_006696 [Xanthocarpia lactea]
MADDNFHHRGADMGDKHGPRGAAAAFATMGQIPTVSGGRRLGTTVSDFSALSRLQNPNLGGFDLNTRFDPFNHVGSFADESLERRATRPHNRAQQEEQLFNEEKVGSSLACHNACHPNNPTQDVLSNAWNDSPKPNHERTLFESPYASDCRKFALEQTLSSFSRPSKHGWHSEDWDNSTEPAIKKTKFAAAAARAPLSSKTHTRDRAKQINRRITKGEMIRRQQADLHRAQKAEKVDQKTQNAVPSTSGISNNPSVLDQSRPSKVTVPQTTNPYASLTSARKRVNRDDDQQNPKAREPSEMASSRRIDRPHAPPVYTRSSTKSKASQRTVLETRKTYYSAEIYQQFANMPNKTKSYTRTEEETLRGIKRLVERCVEAVQQGQDTEEAFADLRDRLHHMQFYDWLSRQLIEKTKVFELTSIGAILINQDNIFPWDLQADAQILAKQVFKYGCDPHLLRGVTTTQNSNEKKSKGYSIDRNYPFLTSANYIGGGDLINGQWWSKRICALRDGAHGATEAGIHGETGKGAYSIIVGGDSGYDDVDDGEMIQYCGTSSDNKDAYGASIPTANTTRMLESCDRLHNTIRVLRKAAGTSKHGTYSPSCGLRYDGLYVVTGKELLHGDTSMYRFTLVREPGQDPIRFKGPEQRPTCYEKRSYHEMFST